MRKLVLQMGVSLDGLVARPGRHGAGGFACAPPGVVHTFSNRSSAPVRFLNLATPAGFEDYMRELSAVMAKASPTSEEIGAIASRYDFKAV